MKVNITWSYPGTSKKGHVSKDWKISKKPREQRNELLDRVSRYRAACKSKGNKVPTPACVWYKADNGYVMVLDFVATKATKLLQWVYPKPGHQFHIEYRDPFDIPPQY